MIYTVTMNPAIDYVVHLTQVLEPGVVNRSTAEVYQFGGKENGGQTPGEDVKIITAAPGGSRCCN